MIQYSCSCSGHNKGDLTKVTITKLSRLLYFLQANYRQNSNIAFGELKVPRNICLQIRTDSIRRYSHFSQSVS